MNSHKNAKLTPRGREEMIRRMETMPAAAVAAGFGVSLRTARKWKKRYREGGREALADRSSRPLPCRSKLTETTVREIYSLRKQRLTGEEIAARLALRRSSVFRVLRRLGCSRLSSLEVKAPVQRYQGNIPGKCCIWISSVWVKLMGSVTERRAHDRYVAVSPAGNTCMFVSMTRRGWHIPQFSRMRQRRQS